MKKDKVLEYINSVENNPLEFKYEDESITVKFELGPEYKDNDELVLWVLDKTSIYYSYNPSKDRYETIPDKWRSSLDIWRHCIYYNKDITIFDVMNSLYKNRNKLYGQYCNWISRRTFKLGRNSEGWLTNVANMNTKDEYDLLFNEWKDIKEI